MTLVNMEAEGIVILPTHRLVSGLEEWTPSKFLQAAAAYFSIARFPFSEAGERQRAIEQMRAAMQATTTPAFGSLFQGDAAFYCLTAREDVAWDTLLPELTPAERLLDVNVLHRIAFGVCLGLDEAAVKQERHIAYLREFDERAECVQQGAAQAAFFLSPVPARQLREIAFAGRVLPQKSTDFYPKLLSGLVAYPLEH